MLGNVQQQVTELNQQAFRYYQQCRYKQAMELASRACELAREHLGDGHWDFAMGLNILGLVYQDVGDYAKAEQFLLQTVEICRSTFGEKHPNLAACLNNLGGLYRTMCRYTEAEPPLRQAIEIRRAVQGDNNLDFAVNLNNLALLYKEMCKYSAAEHLYKQALEIILTTIGERRQDFIVSLNNLAALYIQMKDYAKAGPLLRQALDLCRAMLGEENLDFALSLNNLALFYQQAGNYDAAESLLMRAMEVKRVIVGENHQDFAISLGNLASLYEETGNYAAAEPLRQRAIGVYRTVLGEKNPIFAGQLNHLALFYLKIGNEAAVEPLLRQVIQIGRAVLGENNELLASGLHNLALLRQKMGDYVEAKKFYQQAMDITSVVFGREHRAYATSLNNLGDVYEATGDYITAESFLRQAIEINHKVLGDEHPDYATCLNALAILHQKMGDYSAADPFYHQAMGIRLAALGDTHPDFAQSLSNLATLCAAIDRDGKAMSLIQQALAVDDKMIGQIFSISSESQRSAYVRKVSGNFVALLSLTYQRFSKSHNEVCSALELVLRRKTIGAEALASQRDAVLGGKYPTLQPKLHELTTLRAQIAQRTLAGPGPEGLPTHSQLLAEWNTQKENLEAELARQVPEMNLEQKLRAADRQAVALALPERTALVEFVRFNVFDFKAVPARDESQWKPARYLTFVLPAGEPDNVQMIDLGEAEPIDRMIATFRSTITEEDESAGERGLGAWPVAQGGAASGVAGGGRGESEGQALRAALFDPLMEALGHRTRLLLAPDGDLSRLPFEVLPMDDGRRLIDAYQISYLGAGRDVLRFGAGVSGRATEPVVAADPDFDLDAVGRRAQGAAGETPGRRSRDLNGRDLHFGRLPGTRVEGERIAEMLGVEPWMGSDVLEARIKNCRSPRILHLATHGYFLKDQTRDPNKELRGLGAVEWPTGGASGRLSGPGLENPLLRSMLILAGFNTWFKRGHLPAEAEDGMLTAEDVTGMDLLATELVVLSACETALGEVHVGEGVFGLRRAFVLAGAKTLVMSLWKVPDEQTRELMEDFYRRILAGEGRAEALRQAQLEMKRKYPDPLYWGAFICQGDPAPLPSEG